MITTDTSREVTPDQNSKIVLSSNSLIEEIINIAKKNINDVEKPNVVDKNLDNNLTYNSMTTISGFLENEESECGASDTSLENSEPLGIPVSVFEAFDDFAYVPRQAEREQVAESTTPEISVSYFGRFRVFDYEDHCADPHANLIPKLAESTSLQNCGCPQEALNILQLPTEYGDADCAYIFAWEFKQNI
ncbi:hypothetical protein TSAR_005067, partial [Trichomalopsis sarcophagae]